MNVHVLLHIGQLVESAVAVFKAAGKRLFLSVDSQVIEKVVPLSEDFGAA